jgi:hypothetical protein
LIYDPRTSSRDHTFDRPAFSPGFSMGDQHSHIEVAVMRDAGALDVVMMR